MGLGRYYPRNVYSLRTRFGRLFFRDNFGDITNLVKVVCQGEYRVRQLPQRGAILDVGANIGMASVWFSRYNPGRPIHCFEPVPECAELIQSSCPSAEVHAVAVGARPGRIALQVDADHVIASCIPTQWKTHTEQFEVVTLDDFSRARGLDEVALLKIDAEGMEVEILQGARETLPRTAQVILETHGRERHDQTIALLRDAGFAIDSQQFAGSTGLVFASRGSFPGSDGAAAVPAA
ncbi:MAG: FkbM family methyltransferase [Candidatus Solibacter usitatus]|nr:FkbM family methyltransferase [Candidatus Solibacter usitatus]